MNTLRQIEQMALDDSYTPTLREVAIYTHDAILNNRGILESYNLCDRILRPLLFKAVTRNPAPDPQFYFVELYRICDALGETNDV